MTKQELDKKAFRLNEATKLPVWSGAMTRREYLAMYAEIDPHGCGLFLCRLEHTDFIEDRYWDTPDYREEAIREHRERIKAIRLTYGLSNTEVKEFMRV